MEPEYDIKPCLHEAISKIDDFVVQSTGRRATPEELAKAMTRYFVLKEILAFVTLERQQQEDGSPGS